MSPALIEALVFLTIEAINAGVSLSYILAEARDRGQVSDETWAAILTDIDASEELWRLAGED